MGFQIVSYWSLVVANQKIPCKMAIYHKKCSKHQFETPSKSIFWKIDFRMALLAWSKTVLVKPSDLSPQSRFEEKNVNSLLYTVLNYYVLYRNVNTDGV